MILKQIKRQKEIKDSKILVLNLMNRDQRPHLIKIQIKKMETKAMMKMKQVKKEKKKNNLN